MTFDTPFPDAEVIDAGEVDGITWVTCKAPRYGVNGYARVPEGHPWRTDRECNWIESEVHGGLTYGVAGGEWVGFDTHHSGDVWPDGDHGLLWNGGGIYWTPEMVAAEARKLAREVAANTDAPPRGCGCSCHEEADR